ncbi:GNAT family N-acetyltransferase [Furfurilactobacillus sp. WILCCON 0119]
MWLLKSFSELSTTELYDIMVARIQTFVVDQHRVYQEVDEIDPRARHLFNYEDNHLVAYARIFTEGTTVTFGRILTTPAVRGQGYGRVLLQHVMATLAARYPNYPIQIEAQVQVQNFYRKFGFQPAGEVFLFNTTPHIRMTHQPLTTREVQSASHLDHE